MGCLVLTFHCYGGTCVLHPPCHVLLSMFTFTNTWAYRNSCDFKIISQKNIHCCLTDNHFPFRNRSSIHLEFGLLNRSKRNLHIHILYFIQTIWSYIICFKLFLWLFLLLLLFNRSFSIILIHNSVCSPWPEAFIPTDYIWGV